MMGEFSDRPFMAGTLVGHRVFGATTEGVLIGVTYPTGFYPGENRAQCLIQYDPWSLLHLHLDSMLEPLKKPMQFPLGTDSKAVAALRCECGFYAYTNGSNLYHARASGRIEAIIEGYGICTIGKRGFRAEKARLVALVQPRRPCNRFLRGVLLADAAFLSSAGLIALATSSWLVASVDGALGLLMLFAALTLAGSRTVPRATWKKVRERYEGVPVYRSLEAARKKHPVTDLSQFDQ